MLIWWKIKLQLYNMLNNNKLNNLNIYESSGMWS